MGCKSPNAPLVQKASVDSIFTRPPAYDTIFREASPVSLIRIGRTCRVARAATSDFHYRAFNINRHLSRFVSDPLSFRSLQACTATLISGSNALQFFDRTFYAESDLDLYTHSGFEREVGGWLLKDGYSFVPNSFQADDFESATFDGSSIITDQLHATDLDVAHAQMYRITGVEAVYTFAKESDGNSLKVQVIVTTHTPLEAILSFHSTCVMNFIACDAAYSLYPRATFEDRQALSFAELNEHDTAALQKYAIRGWSITADIWPPDATSKTPFHIDSTRWVRDKYTWTIPLDTSGATPPSHLSPMSASLKEDPVVFNSWTLKKVDKFRMVFNVAHCSIFRYQYLVADNILFRHILAFFREQSHLEHLKTRSISSDDDTKSRTWWDSAIPGIIENFENSLIMDKEKVDDDASSPIVRGRFLRKFNPHKAPAGNSEPKAEPRHIRFGVAWIWKALGIASNFALNLLV